MSVSKHPRRPACLLTLVLMMTAAGCGGGAPPAPAASPAPQPGVLRSPGTPTADSCGDAQSCAAIGIELAKHGDDARAAVALEKACALRDIDACAALASLHSKEKNASHLVAVAHKGCQVEGATPDTRSARGASCRVWGEAVQRETPPGTEPQAAFVAFEDGCKLGDARSCTTLQTLNEQRSFEAAVKEHVGVSNVRVQSMRNGVWSRVACRADTTAPKDPLDMFADQTLLADKESALDSCAPSGGAQVRLVWSADGSRKVTAVKVLGGDASVGSCISKALLGARARRIETCLASAHVGR